YGVGPRIELDCYDAVRRGVPELTGLLDASDPGLPCAAAYALAWFPEDAERSLPAMVKRLSLEPDDVAMANEVLAVGLLSKNSNVSPPRITGDLLFRDALVVRAAAAIALAANPLEGRVLDVLLETVISAGELDALRDSLLFNGGDLAGYASLVLAETG